jgi:hypothetical protein
MRMQPGLQWIENPGGTNADALVAGLRLHLELWGPCPRAVRSGSVDRTRSRAACLTLGAWIPLRIRLMGHIWIRA